MLNDRIRELLAAGFPGAHKDEKQEENRFRIPSVRCGTRRVAQGPEHRITPLVAIILSNVAQIVGRINWRNGFPVGDPFGVCAGVRTGATRFDFGAPLHYLCAVCALEGSPLEPFNCRSLSRIFCAYLISFCHHSRGLCEFRIVASSFPFCRVSSGLLLAAAGGRYPHEPAGAGGGTASGGGDL